MTSYVRSRARMSVAAILCDAPVAACDGEASRRRKRPSPRQASAARDSGGAAPPLPPCRRANRARRRPGARRVQRADATPPIRTIALVLPDGRVAAEASSMRSRDASSAGRFAWMSVITTTASCPMVSSDTRGHLVGRVETVAAYRLIRERARDGARDVDRQMQEVQVDLPRRSATPRASGRARTGRGRY